MDIYELQEEISSGKSLSLSIRHAKLLPAAENKPAFSSHCSFIPSCFLPCSPTCLLPPTLPAYSNFQCLGFQLWCLESAFCKVTLVTLLPLLLEWDSLFSWGQELYYIFPYPPQCFEHSIFIKSFFMVWFLFTLAKCIYSFIPSLNICWVSTGSWGSCCPHFLIKSQFPSHYFLWLAAA